MAKLRSCAPTFLVDDVAATARWYEQNLGFTLSFFPQKPPYVYASLQRDGVEIMLLRQEGYRKPRVERMGGIWDTYIRTDGVRELYEQVRQRVELKSKLTKRPYGDSEFEIEDPNGYVLVFGEQID
jgi:uncharacterized glyoxalase superfamily protein PhnB